MLRTWRYVLILLLAGPTLGPLAADAKPVAERVAKQLDSLLAEELNHSPKILAPRVEDAPFARRVHLDLLGTIPTRDALQAFVNDRATDKRERLVRELLDRPTFGENVARYWRDVILSRRLEDRSLVAEKPLVRDLAKWINTGRPWDAIASDFITATGEVNENGATAILVAQDGRTEEVAAEVSRIFLGVQIQCAQCHDHPWDAWRREQFHELAAFFPRVGVRPKPKTRPPEFVVVVNDRARMPNRKTPPNANRRGWPEHFMPDLDRPQERGTQVTPRFFLTSLEKPIGTPDAERRSALADELTHSDWFATAIVNRVWSELVGEGFYEPVDDLGPERKATAPRAVERLATAFVASGYDLKWLYRTVMGTEAYQRESRPRRLSSQTAMTASVAQPLRGDVLFDALLVALEIEEKDLGRNPKGRARRGRFTPRLLFNSVFGYDPSDPREMVTATIPQALARMNTQMLNQQVLANRDTMLKRLLAESYDDRQLLEELYLRTLSRKPTDQERATALAYRKTMPHSAQPWEDLLWALLNSAEFSHRR